MTRLNYHPAPESVAGRLIAALTAGAGYMTNQEVATHLDVPANNIQPSCKAAIAAGKLCHYSGGRGKVVYYLPGVTVPDMPEAASPAAGRKAKAPKKKTQRARAEATPAEADPDPERPAAIAALWDDGDVVLAGITINLDQGSVTLNDMQARQVHRFLERVYGPTV